jgi:hypothetical protein
MIVGNGEVSEAAAKTIDAADLVVRFNDCRSATNARSRTDVVAVCNTGRPGKAMLASPDWRNHFAVKGASEIWSVRDPAKFAEMRAPLAVSHPVLDDFCDDYTDGFEAFARESGKRHVIIDRTIHEGVDEALEAYQPGPYVVPSSGMVVIAEALARYPDADVAIAGFGHVGWEWHPFSAEKKLVEAMISAGRLRRLDTNFSEPQR